MRRHKTIRNTIWKTLGETVRWAIAQPSGAIKTPSTDQERFFIIHVYGFPILASGMA